MVSHYLPFIWTTNSSIILSQKILNQEIFNFDLSVLANYDSPKFLLSLIISKISIFLNIDIFNLYYYLSYLIVVLTSLFIGCSFNVIISNESNFFYIKYNSIKNILIIILSLGLFSRYTSLLGFGWPSFTSFNILYTVSEQSFSLMLGFIGLYFFSLKKEKISIPLYFLSTLIHPVIGLSNYIFKIILNLNTNLNINKLIKIEIFYFVIKVLIPILLITLIWNNTNISTNSFIDIYVKFRHPHHYLPSYYVNLVFYLLNFCLLYLFLFEFKKRKNLSTICLVVFLWISLSTIFQFFFTEIYPVKIFAKLGLSRLNIYSIIFLKLIFILFFQEYLNNFLKKIIQNPFFLKIKILIEKIYIKKIFIFIIIVIFILMNSLILSKDIFLNINEELTLSNKLKNLNNNDKSKIVQFSENINNFINKTTTIRILSEYNIYSDNVFPFNENYILEWYKRRMETVSFKEDEDYMCYLYNNNIDFYVSEKKLNFEPIFFNNKYYLYEISMNYC